MLYVVARSNTQGNNATQVAAWAGVLLQGLAPTSQNMPGLTPPARRLAAGVDLILSNSLMLPS